MNDLDKLNELSKEEAIALAKDLALNEEYGCFTRQGFEKMIWPRIADAAKWIVFFDVDDMHGLNIKHGYEGVNAIIKKSLAMRESDFMAGQWFSGDEFIVVITDGDPSRDISNPIEFCMRLAQIFRDNGAPSTFAIAPVVSSQLFINVGPAFRLCQKAKANGNRGSINLAPGDPR